LPTLAATPLGHLTDLAAPTCAAVSPLRARLVSLLWSIVVVPQALSSNPHVSGSAMSRMLLDLVM
jgi:hypothetical protein